MFRMILPGSRFGLVVPVLGAMLNHFSPTPRYTDEFGRTPGTENSRTQTAWFHPSWGRPDLRSSNPLGWTSNAMGGFMMIGAGHNVQSHGGSMVQKHSLCIAAVCASGDTCPTSVCYSAKLGLCIPLNGNLWPQYASQVQYRHEQNVPKAYLDGAYRACNEVELEHHKFIVAAK